MNKVEETSYADVASWELSDSLWARIEPLLPKVKSRYRGRGKNRKHIGGRPAADRRKVMAGILYVLRTGCQWNALPKELGSGKTAHRYFQQWVRAGVFLRMWPAGLTEYDELKGLTWKWQAADGAMTKAPLGGERTGKNPTDRGKLGTKRSSLVEANGVPVGRAVEGANRHDKMVAQATLESIPVERPEPTEEHPQGLCLDKGYDYDDTRELVREFRFTAHVRARGEEARALKREAGFKARRWVVERTQSWMNRFRRILIRWEKKVENYFGMLHFVCAWITYRCCGLLG